MSFDNFKFSPQIIYNLTELGYRDPTEIQKRVIPLIQQGGDVIGLAQTGTGKTAAYALPLIDKVARDNNKSFDATNQPSSQKGSDLNKSTGNQVGNLILVPTRELAQQVAQSFESYAFGLDLKVGCVFGGVKINPQMKRLRKGVDFLIATPGRLLDLIDRNAVKFDYFKGLVLDEADRMLDLGFALDLEKIIKQLPTQKQTLLFSATLSDEIEQLAIRSTSSAKKVSVNVRNSAANLVEHWLHPVDKKMKTELLVELLQKNSWRRAIIFVKTKKMAKQLDTALRNNRFKSNSLHGDKSQSERNKAIEQLQNSSIDILVATDVAARGLDVDNLPVVINFDLPKVAEDYIHRIGRTGRAGNRGQALSLVSADEVELLSKIESLLGHLIRREDVPGFVPNHNVPATFLKPIKKKKPHKKKLAKASSQALAASESDSAPSRSGSNASAGIRSAPGFLNTNLNKKQRKRK